jgi:hypothetical protein
MPKDIFQNALNTALTSSLSLVVVGCFADKKASYSFYASPKGFESVSINLKGQNPTPEPISGVVDWKTNGNPDFVS